MSARTSAARLARLSRLMLAFVLVVAALVATSVTATAGETGKQAPDLSGESIRIGDQVGGIRAILEASGLLDDVPYEIEWTDFQAGPPLVEALNAGEIDVGLVGDVPPVFAAASGVDLKVIGAMQTSPEITALVVRPDSPIKSVKDLKGKKIAYGRGTAAQYFILQALQEEGLSLDDIESVNLLLVDGRAAGTSGKVDAWVSSEPLTTLDTTNGAARVVKTGEGLVSGLSFYVAQGESIKEKPAVLADFLERVAESRRWVRANPDKWAPAWSESIGLPAPVLQEVTEKIAARPVPIDAAVIKEIQKIANAFADEDVIPERVKVKKVFTNQFNDVLGT